MKSIFVFEDINAPILFKIILFFRKDKIFILLEKNNFFKKFYILILNIFNIHICLIEDFYAGDIKFKGEAITLYSSKLSRKVIPKIFKNILYNLDLNKNNKLNKFNKFYLMKLISHDVEKVCLKFLLIEHFVPHKKIIFLNSLNTLNENFLRNVLEFNSIKFHKKNFFFINFFFYFHVFLFEILRSKFINFLFKDLKNNLKKNNKILSFQAYSISTNKSLRSQPYWLDYLINQKKNINYFIVYNNFFFRNKSNPKILESEKKLNKEKIYTIPKTLIYQYQSVYDTLHFLYNLFFVFRKSNFQENYLYLKFLFFKNFCQNLYKFSKKEKFKMFVLEENYTQEADAACFVAKKLKKKSISLQYSNLGSKSISMISLCDTQMIFSDLYKKIFSYKGYKPSSFFISGNMFVNDQSEMIERSKILVKKMRNKNVKFIIAYFDERIDKNKFGNNSLDENYREFYELLEYVKKNKKLGLIVKSQFIRYTPSRVYKNNNLIKSLMMSGRYIELENGKLGIGRNDVLPIEAAISSDLTINHKYGATAGLEAAIIGKRSILLNRHGYKSLHDKLYQKANIEFTDVKIAINNIDKYINGKNNSLGDWKKIIHYFCNIKKNKSKDRINQFILKKLK